jgi:uncharacterized membrane protein
MEIELEGAMVIEMIPAKIRVIKRKEQEGRGETSPPKAKEAMREMVANVSQWVNEFQQKKREETTRVLKSLIEPTAQTSGAEA